MNFTKFKAKVQSSYPFAEIDEATVDPLLTWLDQCMYRWWRICQKIEECEFRGEFTILDVGAYPFTAMKVAKVMFPEVRLLGAGLWD